MQDPCLSYYDTNICARCKYGAARIFGSDFILCGYVSGAVNLYDGADPTWDSWNTDCYVDNYYTTTLDIDSVWWYTYQVETTFLNQTTGLAEIMCQPVEIASSLNDEEITDTTICSVTAPYLSAESLA